MKKRINRALPYLILLPAAVIMIGLVYYPIVMTFSYSLKQMKLTKPGDIDWVGAQNYISVLKDDAFWYSLQNTLFLLLIVVLVTTVCGIIAALILNVDSRISGLLMAISILPWAMPPIVNGILWKFIFHPGYGFMNQLLIRLQFIEKPINWMTDRWLLLLVTALVVSWRSVPFCGIVCLSGLRSLPHDVYEAAKIDGGGRWSVFWHITAPLMKPFIGIGITSASITAINIFDEIVALSGYSDLSKNLLIQSYLTTFSFLDFGKGSALTYIIMLITGILGIFYLRSLNKEVHYE